MTKKSLLNQAKQGDPQEIAALITYLMNDQDIVASAEVKQDYLNITLDSIEAPPQASSVDFIQNLMHKLACPNIHTVIVNGKKLGDPKNVWVSYINLGEEDQKNYANQKLDDKEVEKLIKLSKKSLIITLILNLIFMPLSYFYTQRGKPFWMFFASLFIFCFLILLLGRLSYTFYSILFPVYLLYAFLFPIFDNLKAILIARRKLKSLPKVITPIPDSSSSDHIAPNSNHYLSPFPDNTRYHFIFLPLIRSLLLLPIATPILILIGLFATGNFLLALSEAPGITIFSLQIISFLILTALGYIYYFLSWVLFGKWLPKWSSLWESLFAIFLITISSTITLLVVIFVLYQFGQAACQTINEVSEQNSFYRCLGGFFGGLAGEYIKNPGSLPGSNFIIITWVIICSIIYRIEYFCRRFFHPGKLSKFIVLSLIALLVALLATIGGNPELQSVPTSVASETPVSNQEESQFFDNNADEESQFYNDKVDSEADSFKEAIRTATNAAKLTQIAKTHQEWGAVATEWEKAIELMDSVPDYNDNYSIAQERIEQYQHNLEYSQKNATPKPREPYFQQGLNEANVAATLAQTSKSKEEWGFVATQWEKAIENMKAVSSSDVNYAKAQQRIIQYQKNRNYAWLASSKAK